MKPSAMRALLAERGIQLTRSLGQNFLHDVHQLDRLVGLANVQPGDRVLEIGPGLGPLTERLLAAGASVLAIEKDARLVAVLRERFAGTPPGPSLEPTADRSAPAPAPGLCLLPDDALAWLRREPRDWRGWKMVSNLPYSVASPLLVDLTHPEQGPDVVVVTLQLEVTQRLLAAPGSKDYGILTLLVQLGYEPTGSFKISRSCFFPEPDVDSGALGLRRRATPELSPPEQRVFRRVVKRAFSERRKKAIKLLRFDWPGDVLAAAWADFGLAEDVRAERVGRAQFIELARRLAPQDTPVPP